MTLRRLPIIAGLILCLSPSIAQQVSDFSLTNVVNGKAVSLETFPSCSGVAIIFTTNACPYDEYYRGRITKLSNEYADKVPVLLVNSSTDPVESAENMIKISH